MVIFDSLPLRQSKGSFLWMSGVIYLALMTGCASYTDQVKEVRSSYRFGNPTEALKDLEKSDIKEQSRNRLLYLLEKAMIKDRQGESKESRKLLMDADKVVDELYTVSITKSAASWIYNDSTTDYGGEDFEKVAIHTMLALSFLQDHELDSARVEAKKINNRLYDINQGYDNDAKNRYSEDAFARFLSGIIYEAKGDDDSAIIDYKAALEQYKGKYQELFATEFPHDLVTSLYRLAVRRHRSDLVAKLKKDYPALTAKVEKESGGQGDIVVIHEVDTVAIKREEMFVLPISDQIVRFSFPVIRPKQDFDFAQSTITVDSQPPKRSELVQNMDGIASKNLEDRRTRLMLKEGARLLLKGQVTRKLEKDFGPLGYIAGTVYGIFTETADTRGWSLLPSRFYMNRIHLKSGQYDVKIKTNGKLGQIQKVNVLPGKILFLRDKG